MHEEAHQDTRKTSAPCDGLTPASPAKCGSKEPVRRALSRSETPGARSCAARAVRSRPRLSRSRSAPHSGRRESKPIPAPAAQGWRRRAAWWRDTWPSASGLSGAPRRSIGFDQQRRASSRKCQQPIKATQAIQRHVQTTGPGQGLSSRWSCCAAGGRARWLLGACTLGTFGLRQRGMAHLLAVPLLATPTGLRCR